MREPARLAILDGPHSGQVIPLTETETTLGRGATCHVVIEDDFASRRHAQIRLRDDLYWLRDLGSKNGTLLDGQPVREEALLVDGAMIQIGDLRLRFHDPAATATHPVVQAARGALWVDPASRRVWLHGELLEPSLSPKQFDLLLFLWQRPGQAVSKDEIAAAVWPEAGGAVYDYQVDKMVSRLRDRLRSPADAGRSPADAGRSPAGAGRSPPADAGRSPPADAGRSPAGAGRSPPAGAGRDDDRYEKESGELIETVWGYGYRLKV